MDAGGCYIFIVINHDKKYPCKVSPADRRGYLWETIGYNR